MPSTFTFPTRILFGDGARHELVIELGRLGVHRPLVVTDPGLSRLPAVRDLIGNLTGAVTCDAVHENPTESDVRNGLSRYREGSCDGIVAVGGGSPIDAAKALRLLTTHPGRLADYDVTRGGMERITPDLPPLIAVPTTAGTGSEAGRGALIQLEQTGRKTAILSPHLLPSVAICDPELTRTLPPTLTAGTGMDAWTHCVESYLSTTFHPICDGIALEGLSQLARGLEPALLDGGDLDARRSMMMGALLGGISFHKGLGAVHALSHALGSSGRVHHGTLNAILLPHVLRFNREAAGPRLAELASRVGLGRSSDSAGHFISLTELLLARLPLPKRLGEGLGLDRSKLGDYARLAMLDHCHRTNPRPCSEEDFAELLERAW